MLYSTAGSRLYIGQPRAGRLFPDLSGNDLTGESWQEIGELELLGPLGGEWNIIERDPLVGQRFGGFMKGGIIARKVQIVMGADADDPGQQQLVSALGDERGFAFRLILPGAGPAAGRSRFWIALVGSVDEVFDQANSVIKLQAVLYLNSPVVRGGV